jgi:hypothetical protein
MAALGLIRTELTVQDATGVTVHAGREMRFNPLGSGIRQRVTLTASVYTALSVPTGAQFMYVILGTATSLTLKGVTGDQGLALQPSTNPAGFDLLVPLNTTSVGFLNGLASNQTIEVIFV